VAQRGGFEETALVHGMNSLSSLSLSSSSSRPSGPSPPYLLYRYRLIVVGEDKQEDAFVRSVNVEE
jgi:hypothetical protein